jgi:uncharacterized protein involved in exopolysaccharide biosynthesis
MVFKATKKERDGDTKDRFGSVDSAFINSDEMNLDTYLSLLKRHWAFSIKIFLITLLLTFPLILLFKPSYTAEGKIKFLKVDRSSSLAGLNQETGELTPLVSTQNPLNTEVEVLKSKPLVKHLIREVNLKDQQGNFRSTKDVLTKLDAKIISGTDVVLVTYEGKNPNESLKVVNTLMKLYIQSDKDSRRQDAIQAREFIAKQIPPSMQAVQQADKALHLFKAKHKIIALPERLSAVESEKADLDNKLTDAKVELDEITARSDVLRNQLNLNAADAAVISNIAQSESTRNTLKEFQDAEQNLRTLKKIYQDNHPIVGELIDRRNALGAVLTQRVRKLTRDKALTTIPTTRVGGEIGDPAKSQLSDFLATEAKRSSLQKRFTSLSKARSNYEIRVNSLPGLQQTLVELERRQNVAQSTYQALLKRFQELQVAQEEYTSNARIIESAELPIEGSLGLKPYITIAFGLLLGAFLATASIPVKQMLDTRTRYKSNRDESDFHQHSLEFSEPQNLSVKSRSGKI